MFNTKNLILIYRYSNRSPNKMCLLKNPAPLTLFQLFQNRADHSRKTINKKEAHLVPGKPL
jgi:hypothetical protein